MAVAALCREAGEPLPEDLAAVFALRADCRPYLDVFDLLVGLDPSDGMGPVRVRFSDVARCAREASSNHEHRR